MKYLGVSLVTLAVIAIVGFSTFIIFKNDNSIPKEKAQNTATATATPSINISPSPTTFVTATLSPTDAPTPTLSPTTQPTTTPSLTASSTPTATPKPTSTPKPSNSPTPTSAPSPTPTPLPAQRIVFSHKYNYFGWQQYNIKNISFKMPLSISLAPVQQIKREGYINSIPSNISITVENTPLSELVPNNTLSTKNLLIYRNISIKDHNGTLVIRLGERIKYNFYLTLEGKTIVFSLHSFEKALASDSQNIEFFNKIINSITL